MVDAAAVARVAGNIPQDPSGNEIANVFVTPQGHDIQQILKFIGMAVGFSQGADDYLDDDTDGKGLMARNAQYVKDGSSPYSACHAWSGFGYFGAARDSPTPTMKSPVGIVKTGKVIDTNDSAIDLKSEKNFLHSVNCAKRDRASAESAKTDFTRRGTSSLVAPSFSTQVTP